MTSDKVYVAEDTYRQAISVGESWQVTATGGRDSISVNGSNATITAGDGRDTISVGRGVEILTLADVNTSADELSFADKVEENSLIPTAGENAITLSSDYDITLVWQGTGTLTDAIMDYTVNNGGAANTIFDLIKIEYDEVNVNLEEVPESETGYFVVPRTNRETLPTAEYEAEREIRGTIVGSITTENFYVADRSSDASRQNLTVPENWYATATSSSDSISVTGNNATIASGAGNDTISVGEGVRNITLADIDTATDKLVFADEIALASLAQTTIEGGVNLTSDDFTITWRGIGALYDDILNYEITNGDKNNTIRELLAISDDTPEEPEPEEPTPDNPVIPTPEEPTPEEPVPDNHVTPTPVEPAPEEPLPDNPVIPTPVEPEPAPSPLPDDIPSIAEVVVNPSASMHMSFGHWSYGFYPPSENNRAS